MMTFAMIKPLGGVLKRLDTQAIIQELQSIDLKADGAAEKFGIVLVGAILPKIEDVADDVTRLAAAYKGVSYEEALRLDAIATIKDMFGEPGFTDFFKRAAQLAGQK